MISDHEGFGRRLLSDHSTLFLIISNLIMIVFAIVESWSLLTIMFIYWCQSIIIGFFTFLRMLSLKDFSTEGMNNGTLSATTNTKIFMSIFFLFHYYGFHFGYYVFLMSGAFFSSGVRLEIFDISIFIVIAVFFTNHLFSFQYNRKKDANKKPNIGRMMLFPYVRIIPMHLTIILGGAFITTGGAAQGVLLLFLLLKTFADVTMHVIEHRESIANQMKICIDKTNYSPGESIVGKLVLELNRPLKAKSLSISFIVEKIVITGSGDSESTKRYEIHKGEKIFDDGEYMNNTYSFNFQIPSNILDMVKNFDKDSYYIEAKKYAEKFQRWGIKLYREYDSFYIKATFEIPWSLNISNKKEIVIS